MSDYESIKAELVTARMTGDALAALAKQKSDEGDHLLASGLFAASGIIGVLAGRCERMAKLLLDGEERR